MPSDPTEITQPMTMEDAAALEASPNGAAPHALHRGPTRRWWSAARGGVEPWMVGVSIAGLLAGAAAGYWLKKL